MTSFLNAGADDIQFINITDLEDLLDAQEDSQCLFELLMNKTLDDKNMDFKEYIQKIYKGRDLKLRLPRKHFNEAVPKIKIPE